VLLRTDENCEQLFLRDKEVFAEDGETFDLVASDAGDIPLSEIPVGIQVQLCDRVLGSSRDLVTRHPHAVFKNTVNCGLVVQLSTPFIPPTDDATGEGLKHYFEQAIEIGERSLKPLKDAGRLLGLDRNIYEDIAYLIYAINMHDQTMAEAELFAAEIDARVANAYQPPTLFLCHASEDKPFVDKLAEDLNRRAMFAWYDKREILVGDSIVEKINSGLESSDFLIAVLSPRSVSKPWFVRETSSSLMRQLCKDGIRILPLLLEACDIPPLFVDLKYADFSESFEQGMSDLIAAIRR
jgi:hypothetical protein